MKGRDEKWKERSGHLSKVNQTPQLPCILLMNGNQLMLGTCPHLAYLEGPNQKSSLIVHSVITKNISSMAAHSSPSPMLLRKGSGFLRTNAVGSAVESVHLLPVHLKNPVVYVKGITLMFYMRPFPPQRRFA